MNIVSIALRRPIMVLVAIVAVIMSAGFAWTRMPRDIFPDLGIPVIYVAQPYGGMDPSQMEGYLVNYYEYHFLYITGIEHVESKSIQGCGLVKLQFHPGTNMAQAMAETVSYVNRSRAFMPNGTVSPFIMRFDAGSVPVGNLVFSSDKRSVGELQDLALFRVRPKFATLSGVSAPPPFGGSQRSIVIHANPERLRAYGIPPDELVQAIAAANTVTPSGNMNLGKLYPMVPVNAVVRNIKDLEAVPLRMGTTQSVFVRDVANVEDSSDIQTGFALVNGRRTVYIPVTKRADASTLSVVALVKENLPNFQKVLPEDVKVSYEFDQSPYVTRAISGLVMEGLLGAALTGLMVLIFLRDWRSALIVVLNIPLALLASLLALWISGQTVNIMTLGGLALAVGILVDEATVTIENVHTHLARGKPKAQAASDATTETTVPRLLAMLCILAVFIPAFFMVGATKALFAPLSLAVGFAMIASYILSSTFVPILCILMLKDSKHGTEHNQSASSGLQTLYKRVVEGLVKLRWVVIPAYIAVAVLVVISAVPQLGTEIFPSVDAGQFQLRLRAPTGTRIVDTEQIALKTLDTIKQEVGPENVEITLGFVGVQPANYPINSIYLWTGGPEEAVLQVQLKHGVTIHILELQERLRQILPKALPDVQFSFEPSDIVSRVMSFGSATPVEVAVSGPNMAANQAHAENVRAALAKITTLRDLQFGQALDYPTVNVNVDRERAGILGVSETEVARSLVTATSSSRYIVPNFWADPKSGVGYQVQVDIPMAQMNSLEEVRNIPVARKSGDEMLLRSVATVNSGTAFEEVDRYNMQRTVTVNANVFGEDLGRTASKIGKALDELPPPATVAVNVRGQLSPMKQMLDNLQAGLLLAIVVIFLLLAANFQSLRLSLVVVSTVPAVIAGVAVALYVSNTTLNIQSFMGAIMSIGVAVANAILLVTFAERTRLSAGNAIAAAVDGAQSRLRPILMTSSAMIAGMVPMALGLGEGSEQTAPLGRAVIGGLVAATFATLLVLPGVFAIIQGRSSTRSTSLDPSDPGSAYFSKEAAASPH